MINYNMYLKKCFHFIRINNYLIYICSHVVCKQSLSLLGEFYTRFLQGICRENWSSPTLLYMVHAVASVSQSPADHGPTKNPVHSSKNHHQMALLSCCKGVWGSDTVLLLW